MFYNKEQKSYFIIAMIAAVVLVVVTLWRPGDYNFSNLLEKKQVAINSQNERAEYEKYLKELQTDSEAGRKILKELVTDEAVKAEIEQILQVNQKIVEPTIPDSVLSIDKTKGETVLFEYFKDSFGATLQANQQTEAAVESLFSPGISSSLIVKARTQNNDLIRNLRSMSVPVEALAYHKAQILAFEHYDNILESSETYVTNKKNISWSDVYQNYSIINNEIDAANVQFKKLNSQYQFSDALNAHFAKEYANSPIANSANAIFGLGDFTIVVGDIPAEIWKAIREALARAFARFAIEMLDKVVTSIESNFAITSQLYYSDALGQLYTNEYLDKHVSDPLDKEIIKRFIPEYFCLPKDNSDLKDIFTAKARDYLGFDPSQIDPSDPDFYLKLAKSGDFLASPQGQEYYYRDLASQASSAAAGAATKEVLSPGIKSPRDLVNSQINRTMSAIFHTEAAAISGSIQLGTNNTENIVGQLVATVIDNLLNKFVFTGAVLEEQSICVDIPKTKPVIPNTPTDYQYTPPSETPEDYLPAGQTPLPIR